MPTLLDLPEGFRPAGYLYKTVMPRPAWLAAPLVRDIYGISSCISPDFCDYFDKWRHNGFWLFDNPEIMQEMAAAEGIDLAPMTLFYYEIFAREFDTEDRDWFDFDPEPSFPLDVARPVHARLEGFDAASFFAGSKHECSALSCNGLATEIATNEHCLFATFEEARVALEAGRFANAEPGPYRVFAVHTVM